MTFDRNNPTGLSAKPDISFLDDILAGTEDTAIAVSDKFDPKSIPKTAYTSMSTAM